MKIINTSTFVLLICLAGCNEGDNIPDNMGNEISGTWFWLESTGGIAGWTITPASTGDSVRLVFTTSNFEKHVNDTLRNEGPYTITEGPTIYDTQPGNILHIEGETTSSIVLQHSDTLLLREECYDCYIQTFVRSVGSND